MTIKSILKRFLPLPAANANRAEARVIDAIQAVRKEMDELESDIDSLRQRMSEMQRVQDELVWANVFHDAVRGCAWLKDKSFWPGRSALGYQAMYVLFRILGEARPKKILELGLGQSTKLISQYARAYPPASHMVVENNQEWIEFFSKNYELPDATRIVKLDCKRVPYKDEDVRIFDGFAGHFTDDKFDFLLVDAPLGADMKRYSRIDILDIIPQCLEKDFAILIDDTERPGEYYTAGEICRKLDEAEIPHCIRSYNGMKNCMVICSSSLRFLTTL